jgi:replicative DNA helicase
MTIRAAGLGAVDPRVAMNLSFPGRIQITSEKHLGAIHRLLDRNKPDMLYIGPIYKMSSGGLNSEEDAAGVLAALDSIRERGVSLVIEAHAGHTLNGEKGTRNLRPRGSSALLGWPEIGFGLRTDPEAPNESIVERWRGDRDEMAWPSRFKRGGDWPWTPVVSMQEAVDQIGRAIEYGEY